jgi:hypothetical protein
VHLLTTYADDQPDEDMIAHTRHPRAHRNHDNLVSASSDRLRRMSDEPPHRGSHAVRVLPNPDDYSPSLDTSVQTDSAPLMAGNRAHRGSEGESQITGYIRNPEDNRMTHDPPGKDPGAADLVAIARGGDQHGREDSEAVGVAVHHTDGEPNQAYGSDGGSDSLVIHDPDREPVQAIGSDGGIDSSEEARRWPGDPAMASGGNEAVGVHMVARRDDVARGGDHTHADVDCAGCWVFRVCGSVRARKFMQWQTCVSSSHVAAMSLTQDPASLEVLHLFSHLWGCL